MRRDGRLDVRSERVRCGEADERLVINFAAQNEVWIDAIDGAECVARLVLAVHPAERCAELHVLVYAMVQRAAKFLAVVG